MIQKKLIQFNEIKVGMKVLTNGSLENYFNENNFIFGEVKYIHPDYFCVEYNNYSLPENIDLEKVFYNTRTQGGSGGNEYWRCDITPNLKIYNVFNNNTMEYKIGQKIQRNNVIGDCDCEEGDIFIITQVDTSNIWFSKNGKHKDGIDCKDWCFHSPNNIKKEFNLIDEGSIIQQNSECKTESKTKIMLNTLTNKIKRFLNKDLRILFKAQYLTECGDLTEEGWQELKSILIEKFQKELVEAAQAKIDEEEKKK